MTNTPDELITTWLADSPSRDLDAARLDETFRTTAVTRQRRTRPLIGPHPWPRSAPIATGIRPVRVGLVLVLGALLLAGAAIVAGALNRQPAPTALLALIRPDGLYLADADGSGERQMLSGSFTDVAWSPDGTRLAIASDDGQPAIYILAVDGSDLVRLDNGAAFNVRMPAWSPDGSSLIGQLGMPPARPVARDAGPQPREVALLRGWGADGETLWDATLPTTAGRQWQEALTIAWRPDGSSVVVDLRRDLNLCHESVVVSIDGGTAEATLLEDFEGVRDCGAHRPAWSPDGRRLAMLRATDPSCWPWTPDERACPATLVMHDIGGADVSSPLPDPIVIAPKVYPYMQPLWLPDGSGLIVSELGDGETGNLTISGVEVDGGEVRVIGSVETLDPQLRWAESGRSVLIKIAATPGWVSQPGSLVELDLASGVVREIASDVVVAAMQP